METRAGTWIGDTQRWHLDWGHLDWGHSTFGLGTPIIPGWDVDHRRGSSIVSYEKSCPIAGSSAKIEIFRSFVTKVVTAIL